MPETNRDLDVWEAELNEKKRRLREEAKNHVRGGSALTVRTSAPSLTSNSSTSVNSSHSSSSRNPTAEELDADDEIGDMVDDFEAQLTEASTQVVAERAKKKRAQDSAAVVDGSRAGATRAKYKKCDLASLPDIATLRTLPPPDTGMIECHVKRKTVNFSKRYVMTVEGTDGFLLSARKRNKNKSSNYLISVHEADMSRKSDNFHAKLRSNFVGTEFCLYDNGAKAGKPAQPGSPAEPRSQLCFVTYETNLLGTKGPRKMKIALPLVQADGARCTWTPLDGMPASDLIVQAKANASQGIIHLHNKEPTWSDTLKAFVLNFNGRVTRASVKNFQLVDPTNPTRIIMQFGKLGDDDFSLDFQYPMNAVQALGIALSSFDNKLACE